MKVILVADPEVHEANKLRARNLKLMHDTCNSNVFSYLKILYSKLTKNMVAIKVFMKRNFVQDFLDCIAKIS